MANMTNQSLAEEQFCNTNFITKRMISNPQPSTLGPVTIEPSGVVIQTIAIYAFNKQAGRMQVHIVFKLTGILLLHNDN